MARRRKYRAKLHWIVMLLVVAVAGSCAYLSWSEKTGGEGLAVDLPSPGILKDLLDEFTDSDSGQSSSPVADTLPDADLEVHFLDVGQAESILIKAPKANVLIDAGENNQGNDVIRYLEQNGVRQLDIVIGTHPHSDHIGGLDTVIEGMKVKDVILPVIPEEITPTTQTYTDLLLAIATKGLKITPAKPGATYNLGGGVELKILGPVGEYTDLNNMSVVSKLTYGATTFLLTGDAEKQAERDLVDSGANLRADVLNVGHHGSSTSTSDIFLQAVGPQIAVISCGLDNSYGHPHRETIQRLEERSTRILRTDRNGAVIVASNGEQLTVVTER